MLRSCLLLLLGLSLLGCATTLSLPAEDRTRVYQTDFDVVFKALIKTLIQEGYFLNEIDYWGGVITTAERYDTSRKEISQVLASVSEWDDGTHVRLIYVLDSHFSILHTSQPECGYYTVFRSQAGSPRKHSQYSCTIWIEYTETPYRPTFLKPNARRYYDDLFAKIEAAF